MSLSQRDSISTNPDDFHYPLHSDINITSHGADWYWAVTAVMAVSTFVFIGLSYRAHRSRRIFHYITASITLVATCAYFTMASNLGYTPIAVEFARSDPKVAGIYREIFYVRYIDWAITTPLLLLDLLLTCGLPWPTILYTILLDEVMIVTGLVGALVASSYKWGYFVIAMIALFGIFFNVAVVGRNYANVINRTVGRTFLLCGAWTMGLWFIYPIAWGLCEGGNVISADSEAVFYGVLDILAKPVFGGLLLFGHRNIDPATLGLHFRDYNQPPNAISPYAAGAGAGAGAVAGAAHAHNNNAHTTGANVNNGNASHINPNANLYNGSGGNNDGSMNMVNQGTAKDGPVQPVGTHANNSAV
ncbi:Protein FDD123 [Lachnellula suecica]|uniref:Protein FDD123 n=1 Tax=Lachnellula suecica TaxID=602035 RepID=A0A8T9BSC5_9HELO|nr:Protein FDD123 [Lachnellula suecica]